MSRRRQANMMRPHSTLDPSFVASVKRLFNQKGSSFLDIDMTHRLDWRTRRSSSVSQSSSNLPSRSYHPEQKPKSFLDEPASVPPAAEIVISCSELRALCPGAPEELSTFRVRSAQRGRPVTIRDVLSHLDRFLYGEVPADYWPESPTEQDRIECAHRLRVRHLSRTHGRALSTSSHGNRHRTLSMSLAPSTSSTSSSDSTDHKSSNNSRRPSYAGVGVGLGLSVGTLPLPFMQVVECAEMDADGRIVRRDRKVAPRIDWLGGKFFFAGLKKCERVDHGADFELIMEGPWARRRKGPM